jgi:cystathionine beta-synthase
LGAQVVRTPGAPFDALHSNFMEAQRIKQRLNEQNPGCAHVLDQYTNAYNAIAHYDSTAEEMLNQMNDKIDLLVTAAGSGGTISGLARKIKERCPNCIIVGVDPVGSAMAYPESLNKVEGSSFYEMEGMGHDFLPTVLDRTQIDAWVKSKDKDSFEMSRQLIKREGLLCGGSSGAVAYCAIEAIKKYNIKENQNVVVLLPDSIRNYM